MKKALVTGADGFIGSHLVEYLLEKGYQVRALAQYNSFNSAGWLDGVVHPSLEIQYGDVRDAFFCDALCQDIDVVFHLAALIAIPYSYSAPQSYIETNVNGTLNLCQAALRHGVKRFLQTSTSEVYGTAQYVPIDEKHPLQAQSPYSASKIAADALAMSYYHAFNLPVTIVRPFNTYGPRQSARAVIPTIISQIATGATRIKLGDTSPTRDFNYVQDTCVGFEVLSRCDAAIGETVNISSNYEISVADTLDLIRSLMKSDVEFVMDEQRLRPAGSEVFRLWGDNSKLVQLTGFSPEVDLSEGLRRTIEWFTKPLHLARYKANQYNK
ncbi:MAG: NAD-dependent 4,6-dehydratase LegB [Gammaproteobacteria bacterium]|nr:NAD-dependent 4,6-dehydratase LegB [Gammaproteobacteria bacterium]MBU2058377.1 NAD-dependent 4,6-dehydratase LegB [Gammaproteobacteria bacterium]MBU2176570.1 NAD-dependent 4,6-dehydratase LegB [Gammaproteobacteria bacterium]MBU2248488.1 NAD-dependent 4,6-dehydratase LegB [Gammaproteobacteria bacterium]MBU2345649.1 NAD-dependent 4,6-dehydratase LegB [Gammaproteobacteria bacterium]